MIPYFEWKTIDLGPLTLQVWGMWVALGMILALGLLKIRSKALKLDTNKLLDLSVWMIVSGIIFSRLFVVFFYNPHFYFSHPFEIIKIWHGGLSSFGGLFGAALVFFWYIKRQKILQKQWIKIADTLSFSALFGWIVGRIGCLFIHDHIGRPCDCFLAVKFSDGPRLEMALLEILALLPLAILFFISRKKQKPEGYFTSLLFIYYGIVRFILDFFRATDIIGADARYLGLTPGQYSALLLVLAGVWLFKKNKVRL